MNLTGHRVFGLQMRPYSLWHKLQLEAVDSPFLTGAQITPAAVEVLARVCCTEYPRSADLRTPRGIRRMLWLLRRSAYQWQTEAARANAYLTDYASYPKYWGDKIGGAGSRQIDDGLEIVSFLALKTGWADTYIWNLPVGMAHWYSAGIRICEGAEGLVMSPDDEAAYEAHLERKRKWLVDRTAELIAGGMTPDDAATQAKAEQEAEKQKKMADMAAAQAASRHMKH